MIKIFYIILWLLLPFAIGAAFEFLPLWMAIPATVVIGFYWIGVNITLSKELK